MKRTAQAIGMAILLTAIGSTALPGENTAPPKPGFTLADLKAQIPQDKDGVFLMELPEILNAATDPEVRSLLDGQPVATSGQVISGSENPADGRNLRIYRSQLSCCAEHARQCSVSIRITGKVPAIKGNPWIRVVGTMTYKQEGGKTQPVIMAREINETTPPDNPVLK